MSPLTNGRVTFLALAALTIAGLACSLATALPTSAPPTDVPPPAPTSTSPPATRTPHPSPTPKPRPTATPSPTPIPRFFTETFTSHRVDRYWETFYVGPNKDAEHLVERSYNDNKFNLKIDIPDMYVYMLYNLYEYDDVFLEINFTNKGVNSQNVGLVCRYSQDGWYELSVGNDGLWYFYYYDPSYGFRLVYNGGSNRVNMGKKANTYGLKCIGERAHIYINGEEVRGSPINLTQYPLTSGAVGLNVSSLGVYPVIVQIDWLKISPP